MRKLFWKKEPPGLAKLLNCNNTRVKWVSIEIYGKVWRDQPRGKTLGEPEYRDTERVKSPLTKSAGGGTGILTQAKNSKGKSAINVPWRQLSKHRE